MSRASSNNSKTNTPQTPTRSDLFPKVLLQNENKPPPPNDASCNQITSAIPSPRKARKGLRSIDPDELEQKKSTGNTISPNPPTNISAVLHTEPTTVDALPALSKLREVMRDNSDSDEEGDVATPDFRRLPSHLNWMVNGITTNSFGNKVVFYNWTCINECMNDSNISIFMNEDPYMPDWPKPGRPSDPLIFDPEQQIGPTFMMVHFANVCTDVPATDIHKFAQAIKEDNFIYVERDWECIAKAHKGYFSAYRHWDSSSSSSSSSSGFSEESSEQEDEEVEELEEKDYNDPNNHPCLWKRPKWREEFGWPPLTPSPVSSPSPVPSPSADDMIATSLAPVSQQPAATTSAGELPVIPPPTAAGTPSPEK